MMKLEDYDTLLTESEEEMEESEEYSIGQSIGGESFYKYTKSAEQKYSKRFQVQKQVAGKIPSKKDKSAKTPKGNLTPKIKERVSIFKK